MDNAIFSITEFLASVVRGVASCCGGIGAEETVAELTARLKKLPQPWKQPVPRISAEAYEATLRYWANANDEILTLERRRLTREGQPIFFGDDYGQQCRRRRQAGLFDYGIALWSRAIGHDDDNAFDRMVVG